MISVQRGFSKSHSYFYFFHFVAQIITARHCDITAFAFSVITNKCVTEYECQEEPGHEEVVEVGKSRQFVLAEYVRRLVNHIAGK